MKSLLVSIGVVALAEMGDKTQLLAFIMAARFKRPMIIIVGILMATLINHGLAGAVGAWLIAILSPQNLRWILGVSFIAMGCWTLIPDKIENDGAKVSMQFGVLGATFITFFLAEMGDKTQLATIALTAHYGTPVIIIIGTTIGLLLADIPAVLLGNKFADKIPMKLVRGVAASLFVLMGIFTPVEFDKFVA